MDASHSDRLDAIHERAAILNVDAISMVIHITRSNSHPDFDATAKKHAHRSSFPKACVGNPADSEDAVSSTF